MAVLKRSCSLDEISMRKLDGMLGFIREIRLCEPPIHYFESLTVWIAYIRVTLHRLSSEKY